MKGQGLRLAQRHREARRRRDKPAFSQRKHPRNCEIYRTFLYHSIVLGLGRARGQRGELLPSSLHRGDTLGERFWHFLCVNGCEAAGSENSIPAAADRYGQTKELKDKTRYCLQILLCARRACPAASVSSVSLCETVPRLFPRHSAFSIPNSALVRLTFFLAYKKIPTCPVPDISQVTG